MVHGRTRTFYVINGYTEMTRTLGSTHVALRFWKILRFRALVNIGQCLELYQISMLYDQLLNSIFD